MTNPLDALPAAELPTGVVMALLGLTPYMFDEHGDDHVAFGAVSPSSGNLVLQAYYNCRVGRWVCVPDGWFAEREALRALLATDKSET